MTKQLDLADIQGNILRDYGLVFPFARFFFLRINNAAAGRAFILALGPKITNAIAWHADPDYPGDLTQPRPPVAINIAFTFFGLVALELPTATLAGMPSEFIDGMAARAHILGDDGGPHCRELRESTSSAYVAPPRAPQHWDRIWRNFDGYGRTNVHVMVALNAQMQPDGKAVAELEAETRWLTQLCSSLNGGVVLLSGHAGGDSDFCQDGSAIMAVGEDGVVRPTPKEHFGFTDGFGNPVFEGQYPPGRDKLAAVGGGKIMPGPEQRWEPLATGEFLLGHPDEAQEIPGASMPLAFSRNGTFVAYRKLHENVGSFRSYIADVAKSYARVMDVGLVEAAETVKAKMVGRWEDGVPLMAAPTYAAWRAFNERLEAAKKAGNKAEITAMRAAYFNFRYRADPAGTTCPVTSHMRRVNTRDMLDPTLTQDMFDPSHPSKKDPASWRGSVLNNRRRILRRGLPYGTSAPDSDDSGNHGIIFMVVCASLFRQFEFVQQQWVQYGLDVNAGNDTDPLLGNHDEHAKFVIPADPGSGKPPFICDRLPQFVECRGGDYFFMPSMNALRMMAMGVIDPT
jgi:Dyp-type peroxidase family